MNWDNKLGCYCINSLSQIDLKLLQVKQIKLLIFDIRGTIINQHQIDSYLLKLMKQINDLNYFKVLFATNNCAYYTNKVRHELIAINFIASYLYFACKPLLFCIKHAVKKMGLLSLITNNTSQIAIIGNQLNTDGKLATKLHGTLIYFQNNSDK